MAATQCAIRLAGDSRLHKIVARAVCSARLFNGSGCADLYLAVGVGAAYIVTYIGLSLVPQYAELGATVQDFVFRTRASQSELVQQNSMNLLIARSLTTVGGAGLFLVALLMLVSIEQRFNTIWQVATPRWGLQRFWRIGVLSLGPAFLLVGHGVAPV